MINSVKHIEDYLLEVRFEDGTIKIVDFKSFVHEERSPMTTQFKDKDRFANAEVCAGHLTWEDGQMDISSESIYRGDFDTSNSF